jgi:hypothetical protein
MSEIPLEHLLQAADIDMETLWVQRFTDPLTVLRHSLHPQTQHPEPAATFALEPSGIHNERRQESDMEALEETFVASKVRMFEYALWHELSDKIDQVGLSLLNLGRLGETLPQMIEQQVSDERDRVLYRRALETALWNVQQIAKDEIANAVVVSMQRDPTVLRTAAREAMLACMEVGDEDMDLSVYISTRVSDLLGLPQTGWNQYGDRMTEPHVLHVMPGEISDEPRAEHPTTRELYDWYSMSLQQSRSADNEEFKEHMQQCVECNEMVMRWLKKG